MIRHCMSPSWPGLSRPSTPYFAVAKTWMPGTRPGMTNREAVTRRGRSLKCVAGFSVVAAAVSSAAMAQGSSPFNTDECRERTGLHWCASKTSAQRWKLKYESKSPADLMDAHWQTELWTRGNGTMLCEFIGGRGAVQTNICREMCEVTQ